jgi:hypothetical protein
MKNMSKEDTNDKNLSKEKAMKFFSLVPREMADEITHRFKTLKIILNLLVFFSLKKKKNFLEKKRRQKQLLKNFCRHN